jgi:hypothetical protein
MPGFTADTTGTAANPARPATRPRRTSRRARRRTWGLLIHIDLLQVCTRVLRQDFSPRCVRYRRAGRSAAGRETGRIQGADPAASNSTAVLPSQTMGDRAETPITAAPALGGRRLSVHRQGPGIGGAADARGETVGPRRLLRLRRSLDDRGRRTGYRESRRLVRPLVRTARTARSGASRSVAANSAVANPSAGHVDLESRVGTALARTQPTQGLALSRDLISEKSATPILSLEGARRAQHMRAPWKELVSRPGAKFNEEVSASVSDAASGQDSGRPCRGGRRIWPIAAYNKKQASSARCSLSLFLPGVRPCDGSPWCCC